MTHAAAGDLTEYVVFRRYGETGRDGFNEEVGGWAELEAAWAERRDLSDAEKIAAGDQVGQLRTRFKLRWTPKLDTLTSQDRIVADGVDWNIVGRKVLGEPLDRMIEITAERRSDEDVAP